MYPLLPCCCDQVPPRAASGRKVIFWATGQEHGPSSWGSHGGRNSRAGTHRGFSKEMGDRNCPDEAFRWKWGERLRTAGGACLNQDRSFDRVCVRTGGELTEVGQLRHRAQDGQDLQSRSLQDLGSSKHRGSLLTSAE